MGDDIKFWRGRRISELTADELRVALAEVYRELERLSWLTHQQKLIIEKGGKKRGRHKKQEPEEDLEEALA
jgi:hypothetical protein